MKSTVLAIPACAGLMKSIVLAFPACAGLMKSIVLAIHHHIVTLTFSLVGAGAPAPCRSGVPQANFPLTGFNSRLLKTASFSTFFAV
jgi:hypothetical protein